MLQSMSPSLIAKYVTPWKYRREEEERRIAALKLRDGADCRRCRRPLRFDLPRGHDLGPKVEAVVSAAPGEPVALDNLCLTHGRCHAESDLTREVTDRVRRKAEAELFATSRKKRRRA
jgi:hypothetical protein